MSGAVNHSTHKTESQWSMNWDENAKSQTACFIIGAALVAIAGLASYYCLTNGLTMIDTAYTSLSQFGAGFLIYSGVVFSIVACMNAVFTGAKLLCHESGEDFDYTPNTMKKQIGISILAPIAFVPAIICCGLCAVGASR